MNGIAINVGAFALTQGVRRSLQALSMVYAQPSSSVLSLTRQVTAGSSVEMSLPDASTTAFVLSTDNPVLVDVSYQSVAIGETVRPAGSVSLLVSRVLVLDDGITGIVVSNPGSVDAQVTFCGV